MRVKRDRCRLGGCVGRGSIGCGEVGIGFMVRSLGLR